MRYLILRQSQISKALLLGIVTSREKFPEGKRLARALRRKVPKLIGIVQNVNPSKGNVIEGTTNILLDGRERMDDRMGRFKVVVSISSFLQGNHPMAEKIYQAMSYNTMWHKQDILFDLFCGMGLSGLHLAHRVKQVVGVDVNEEAIGNARLNKHLNKKTNMAFLAGRVERMLNTATKRFGEASALIANPPRKGLGPDLLRWIARSKVQKMAYLSCSPKSLAEDLQQMTKAGFQVQEIRGFDLYPQTEQIETLALLHR